MREKFYHPELDSLRFFAFLAVFIHHFFPRDPLPYSKLGHLPATLLAGCVEAGGLGVDLFFCLSSFLITTLLLREFDQRGTLDVRAFWIRRILRIWPLYYFFLAVTVIIVPHFLPDRLHGLYLLAYAVFGGNYACLANGYPESVAAPLWSVSIEEQFYIAWPLLLSMFSCRRLPHLAFVCLFIASVMRVIMVSLAVPHPGIWCNTFSRLDPIAMGALFAVVTVHRRYHLPAWARSLLVVVAVVLPPALIVVFGEGCFSGTASILFYPVVALCCVLVLAATFRNGDDSSARGNSRVRAALVYLGRISYGLYVYHILGIGLAGSIMRQGGTVALLPKAADVAGRLMVASGLTVGFAAASYALLEKPFLRLKERFTYVDSSPTAATRLPDNHPIPMCKR